LYTSRVIIIHLQNIKIIEVEDVKKSFIDVTLSISINNLTKLVKRVNLSER